MALPFVQWPGHLAQFTWQNSELFSELPPEMAQIFEAQIPSDVAHGFIGRHQLVLGALDPAAERKLIRRHSGGLVKQPGKVPRAQATMIGDVCKSNLCAQVFLDIVDAFQHKVLAAPLHPDIFPTSMQAFRIDPFPHDRKKRPCAKHSLTLECRIAWD
jgi:hypothetical protein